MRRFAPVGGRVVSLLVAVVGVVVLVDCGSSNPTGPTIDPSVLPSMDLMLADKTIGSATAPNTVIEYSSLECPFCKQFHDTMLSSLKTEYIDTGKVRFVYRDSPLNTGFDLTASMLARCAGDRFFDAVDALYAARDSWATASDQTGAIENVMRGFGMSQAVIAACEASTTLKNGILQMKQSGQQRYQYTSVPTFIVNDKYCSSGALGIGPIVNCLNP